LSLALGPAIQIVWQSWKIAAVLARGRFVQQPAQREQISALTARSFGWNESLRAHERALFIDARHQTDVRELGLAVDEDDIRRFDIAMHQPMPVKMPKRAGQLHAQGDRIGY